MKLVLEAEGVKRELAGPFNMAASIGDLECLRDQIDYVLENWKRDGCSYGWAAIYPKATGAGCATTPRKWSD